MKIKFCGAARQVTGSMHLLELDNGYKLLVDCGLNHEQQRNFTRAGDASFLFDPATIDCVVLTHAHIDHSGNIPTLIKHGFGGKILCTPPTADLTSYLLLDSLKIMESEEKKKNRDKKKVRVSPIFGYKHYKEAMERFVTVHFNQTFSLNSSIELTFTEAGHILGAAGVRLKITEGKDEVVLGFTGDIGNYGSKLMRDPDPLKDVDYLISESTYGGRYHKSTRTPEDELLHYVVETCVSQPGRLVIPAFSVGRTQAILYTLHRLHSQGMLPEGVKYFVDSPLAIKTTHIYQHYQQYMNEEARQFYKRHGSLFEFEGLSYIMNRADSEQLDTYYEPCVIISAAGMVEGGRIQEHVRNNIRNSYCTILIAGYCAEGTLGHRLLHGEGSIYIHGKEFPVFAKIAATDVFSAHPDHNGLLRYFEEAGVRNSKGVFFVHGEAVSMERLKEDMQAKGYQNLVIPELGQEFGLSKGYDKVTESAFGQEK